MIQTIKTERLLLREFREEDLDAYGAMCSDSEVMKFIGNGELLTRSQTWEQMALILGHWNLRGYGMWAVEEQDSGKFIGRIGFIDSEGWPGFELGWLLGRPYWGNGYATEGAKYALEYAFTELEKQHVISLIYPDNKASIQVALRLGEKLERETVLFGNRVLVYGIDRDVI